MERRKWQEVLLELTIAHEGNLLKINKQDIVTFCMESKRLRNSIDVFLKNIKVIQKDTTVALQNKEEGNKQFLEKNYQKCLQLYTKSIFHANKNDDVLPLAYANRAFVLQVLGYLTESLADTKMALATGYPKDKATKLELRMTKWSEQFKKGKGKKPLNEYQLPELSGGENNNFASASAYLSVNFDETKGRHVKATKDIKVGEVLFVEKAFAFVVCEEVCGHCMKRTVAPIPCENCLDVIYCSWECREESSKSVHSFECGFGELFDSVGIGHLGVAVVTAASSSLEELKKELNGICEAKYEDGTIVFKGKGYENVYNLVHHLDSFEVNDLFQYAMTALLLATFMKNHTNYFPVKSGDDDLKLLTSVILRHILQMICNGHTVMETFVKGTMESVKLSKAEHRIGTAIYPSVSMMNHSCLPSVVIGFYKSYIVVEAAREIKEGEEVFNCYVADARRMRRAERQEILWKQYFFRCQCEVCAETIDTQDRFTALKCSACKGPSTQKDRSSMEAICMDCGQTFKIADQLLMKGKSL